MTFLPIVERELRVAARRRGTYGTRLVIALAALGAGGWVMLVQVAQSPAKVGLTLFVTLAVIAFGYSLFVCLGTTTDCLSLEKRENTLGLLFLTDLRGYDVVLGKLAASSLNALYGILAVFPVLAISLLAGGVSGAEFGRVVLVLLNNLFFSLAVGIFCSALCRDERRAGGLAAVLITGLTILLPFIYGFNALRASARPLSPLWLVPSPGFAAALAFDEFRRTTPPAFLALFLPSLLCIHGLSWLLLALASVIVPRSWQDKTEGPLRSRWRDWQIRLTYGAPARRQKLRARMLDLNPVFWLAGRDRLKNILVWGFLGAMAALWGYGLCLYPDLWHEEAAFIFTAFTLHTVLKLWMGTEASRRFSADRNSGALELLLATPLSVRQILTGQLLALWKQFAAPTTVVVLADLVCLMGKRYQDKWVLGWAALVAMLIADLVALSWVGMWTGLSHRNPARAASSALFRILVLPWLIFTLLAGLAPAQTGPTRVDESTGIIIWLLIGLVLDAYFGVHARSRLLANFRKTAAERFQGSRFKVQGSGLTSEP